MSLPEIARRRLHAQRLAGEAFDVPAHAVGWLVAVQSQDFAAAKWAIAQRTVAATDAALQRAFDEGAILRTHVLRPTWHCVLPDDVRWLLALSGPIVDAGNAYYYRKLGLDTRLLAKSEKVIAKAIAGRHATRNELATELARRGVEVTGTHLALVMMHAELVGLVVSGAMRGKEHTYALLDERVPPQSRTFDRAAALGELATRYFASHGPATLQDFAWWSGLPAADARAAVEAATSALTRETSAKTTYYLAMEAARAARSGPTVHFLPNYDEHLVAYKDHGASYDAAILEGGARRVDALMGNVIVLDGKIVGVWRRETQKRSTTVKTELFVRFGKAHRAALAAALTRYAAYLGRPVVLA